MRLQVLLPIFALLTVTLVSCDQAGVAESRQQIAATGPSSNSGLAVNPDPNAIDVIARSLALSLGNPTVRSQAKAAMRNSRHTVEHKLHFQQILTTGPGSQLLTLMANQANLTIQEMQDLLDEAGPLELYIPVDEHRNTWAGGGDIIVAWVTEDDDTPVGYDLSGHSVTLDPEVAPQTTTLALVPMETNFAEELDEVGFENENDENGTIGTYVPTGIGEGSIAMPECDLEADCGEGGGNTGGGSTGGGNNGGTNPPPGLYLTLSQPYDVQESWIRGDPEIEVHVIEGFSQSNINNYLPDTEYTSVCQAGQYNSVPYSRRFDQNDTSWWGRVMILSQDQLEDFPVDPDNPDVTPRALTVVLWEDDDKPCELVTALDLQSEFVDFALAGLAIFGGLIVDDAPNIYNNDYVGLAVGLGIGYVLIDRGLNLLATNDDLVGIATFTENSPSWTHYLYKEDQQLNGGVRLIQYD